LAVEPPVVEEVVAALATVAGVVAVLAIGVVVTAGVVGDTVPLISAWTVALKVPVMPVRANLAENASAMNWDWVGSGALLDVNLIK